MWLPAVHIQETRPLHAGTLTDQQGSGQHLWVVWTLSAAVLKAARLQPEDVVLG